MINGLGQSEALVRAGCRLAENRLATWTVVAFMDDQYQQKKDNPQTHQTDAQSREIERALNLCRQLGGMTEILYGQQHAKILSEFALERGISTLVLAQAQAKKYSFNFKSNLIAQILKHHPHFELSIVPIQSKQKPLHPVTQIRLFLSVKESILVLFTTIVSIIMASLGERYLGIEELSVIFITAVVFVASKTRMIAAACSAIIFFLAYNFFFIAPKYTFQISAHQGVITVVAFLAAALIASRLASRLREQVTALKAANSYNSIMQDLGQKLSTGCK